MLETSDRRDSGPLVRNEGKVISGERPGGEILHLALDSTSNGRQKDAIYNHYCSVFGALWV